MRKWEDIVRDKMEEPEGELPESVFAEFRARRDAAAPAPKRFQPLWLLAPAMAAALAVVLILQKPAVSEKDSLVAPQETALVAEAAVPEDSVEAVQDAAAEDSAEAAQAAVLPASSANQAKSSSLVVEATPAAPKATRQALAEPQQAATTESAEAEETAKAEELPEKTDGAAKEAPAETAATSAETAPSSGKAASSERAATPARTPASPVVPERAKARRSVGRIVIPTASVLAGGGLLATAVPLLFGMRDNMEVPPGPVIGENPTQQDMPEDKPTGNVHHFFPLRLGLSARFPVGERLSVTTGLDYFRYKSAIDYTLSADKMQIAHYLGIPVRLDWTFASTKRLDFYLGGGLEADWCLGAKFEGGPVASDGFCASLLGAGGIQLNISKHVGLYVEPQLSWAFTPDYLDLKTYRNVHPLMFSVTSGLRFTIGN